MVGWVASEAEGCLTGIEHSTLRSEEFLRYTAVELTDLVNALLVSAGELTMEILS